MRITNRKKENCMKLFSVRHLAIGAICAVALALCGLFVAVQPAHAEVSAYKYSSSKALAYSKAHSKDKKAYDGGKLDCVKFVRKSIETGGIPKDKFHSYGYTPDDYVAYLVGNSLAKKNLLTTQNWHFVTGTTTHDRPETQVINANTNAGKVGVGDVLAYRCKKCKHFYHVGIVGGVTGEHGTSNEGKTDNLVTVYAHNVNVSNTMALKIKCSRCKAAPSQTEIYSLQMRSAENGFQKVAVAKTSIKSLKSASKKTVTFNVAKKNVTGYEVRYGRSNVMKGAYTKSFKGAAKTALKIKDNRLQSGKNYYCQARSYKTVGGVKYYSDWTPIKKVKVK